MELVREALGSLLSLAPCALCHSRRHLGTKLNWRRDPDDEQLKRQHEWRMKQIEKETEQL